MKFNWIVLGILCLSSCKTKTVPQSAPVSNQPLENSHWRLVWVSGIPDNIPNMPKQPFLQMKNGIASGSAGCNNYFGSYSFTQDSIHFSSMGSTKMFCAGKMDIEDNLYDALDKANLYKIHGIQLELYNSTVIVARFESVKVTK